MAKGKNVDISASKVWSCIKDVNTSTLSANIKEFEKIVCEKLYPNFQSPKSLKVYQNYAKHMNTNRFWVKEIDGAINRCREAKKYQ